MSKYVYFFGAGKADGRADMKNLLGGKGANLAEMTNIGLPVPAGFTIPPKSAPISTTTSAPIPKLKLIDQVAEAIEEEPWAPSSAIAKNPLLVSCRSGARDSHAGHDGHRPQYRPERQDRLGPDREDRQRTLRLG